MNVSNMEFSWLLGMLDGIPGMLPTQHPLIMLAHQGDPVPAARARVTKNGTFIPKKQQAAMSELAAGFERVFPDGPLNGNLAIACVFFRASRRTVDGDNLMKLVTDAGTGIGWKDDAQFTGHASCLMLSRELPRTLIAVTRHRSTLTR